ncbi:hypothetical protein [Neorhodopirellula lusitana]|uniref:hypothetical protein n=1 Tax=Neorhodopirellula lusitana TaxID=445327 RepID=UPI00384D16D0
MPNSRLHRFLIVLGYLWASPNSLLALAIGLLLGGRFKMVDGVVEIHGKHIARILQRFPNPAAAITIGHVVMGQTLRMLDQTRRHERVHVQQYARWGPFFLPAYTLASGFLYAIGRDGYRDNPFEIEAFAVDDLR